MWEATRAHVAARGVRHLKQGVLLRDFSWKFGRNGFCSGSLGSGCAAFLAFRDIFTTSTQERGHPRLVSVSSQAQHSCSTAWADQNHNCVLERNNIDLTTWLLAETLDGYAAGQAIDDMVFRPGGFLVETYRI